MYTWYVVATWACGVTKTLTQRSIEDYSDFTSLTSNIIMPHIHLSISVEYDTFRVRECIIMAPIVMALSHYTGRGQTGPCRLILI